ncbi:arginine--tRNA ligase, partial [bacterium]|nr:arginine--tRNA ligase [bacterium]
MIKNIYSQISEQIVISFPLLSEKDIVIKEAPNRELGDICLVCFKLADKLKMTPIEAASHIAEKVNDLPKVKTVKTTGPYVNFFLDREPLANELYKDITTKQHFGSSKSGKGQKFLIEHTSINPNASPHVGRSRNALIGDSLARMLRYEGYDVEVHYYINDMGKQIALLVMECAGKDDLRFDEILSFYVEANKKAATDSDYEKKAFALLKKFEDHDPEVIREFKRVTDLCVKGQLEIISMLNISYDFFDRESDYIHDPKVEFIEDQMKTAGSLFVDEHGRSVLDLQKIGFEKEEGRFFVLKRGNGSTMYGYRDIAYTIDKLSKSPDKNIIILGEDHKLYFQQLGTILNAVDLTPPEAIHYSYILLKDGKMSTRLGNVVLLKDFLEEAVSRVKERIDSAYSHLSEEEKSAISTAVGIGA